MKVKSLIIVLHVIICLFILVIPYVTTDQIYNSLAPTTDINYFLLSAVLILIFYFNYFFLIPRFLLTKKYLLYFIFLFCCIIAVFLFSSTIYFFVEFTPSTLDESDPLFKVFPVIIVNALLVWLLAIVFSILWTYLLRLKQIESEKHAAQISSLKSQINPHFLFNTLNNIYATAIDTAPKTADMIDKLAEMMRYTMKETQHDFVPLENEVNYIDNYIKLQKFRLDNSVKLEYNTLEKFSFFKIAPMLLIPFIENAFKHGVNSEQKSHIKIGMTMNKTEFQLFVVNKKVDVQKSISESSGLGIENTRLRLNLIYPTKHLLVIDDGLKEFSVSLHINLQ